MHRNSHAAIQAQRERVRAFVQLLDPKDLMPGHTVADLYSLRHLSFQGVPDSPPWLRAQAWKVLLGYLPPEKKEWQAVLGKRRREYYQFVADFLPLASSDPHEANGKLSPRDTALDQIYKDLARSRKNNFAFYQNEVRPTWSCPLSPLPDDPSGSESDAEGQARSQGRKRKRKVPRLDCRHALLRRLEMINTDYAASVRTSSRVPSTASASASLTDRDSTMSEASSTATTATSSTFSKGKWREQLHPGGNVPEPSPSGTGSAFEFDSELDRSENASVAEEASAQTGPMSPPIYLSPPSPSGGSSDSSFASAVEGSEPAPDETPKPDTSQAFDAPKPPPKGAESFQRPNGVARSDAERPFADLQWHSLLRILYIYALLNPSTGYIQGMNEVLFVIHYVLGSSGHHSPAFDTPLQGSPELDPSTGNASDPSIEDFGQDDDFEGPATHAEADAFWCFSALIGEVRELYEFEGVDHGAAGLRILSPRLPVEGNSGDVGMAGALKRLSLRLKWLDPDLWKNLRANSLEPRLPYYSFRWLACLVSTELSLPSVVRLWDAILAEQAEPVDAASSSAASSSAKIEFLIDICCALLINLRERLLSNPEEEDRFARGIQVLQNYPDEDVGPIVEMAYVTRQRRLAASLTGDGPPLENEDADEAVGSSVRARAGNALRAWASSSSNNSTPSKGRAWFGSVGRSVSGSSSSSSPAPEVEFEQAHRSASVESTPNRSPGTMFQRYAEAFKSSDAAANLSKASTNWTATALATWDRDPASKSSPTTNGRLPSIGAVSSNLFKKARATQSPNGSPSTPETLHPASMRWSRDTMPDFPLPNMADSPPGRQEYPRGRPGSSTWPKHVAAPSSPASSLGQSPPNSPLPLPSLRAAAKLGMLPRHREPIGSVRGAGPKPLLLTGSARPPREGSGSFPAVDEPSRKISTGPLAASPHSRGTSQNGGGSSYAGSVTGRSENSASDDGSSVSRRTSLNDSAQSPTLEHAMRAPTSAGASFGEPASNGPIGLVGSGHGTGKGTVPAGAFAKVRAAAAGERADQLAANRLEADADSFCSTAPPPSERSEGANLNFGDASSSADVPLVPTAGRATRTRGRKEASSGGTGSGSDAGLQWEQTRSLVVGESDGGASRAIPETVEKRGKAERMLDMPRRQSGSGSDDSLPIFESPRPAPSPPGHSGSGSSSTGPAGLGIGIPGGVGRRRYELNDGPMRPTLYDEPVEALHLRDEPETLADARTARARRPSDHHNGSASVPSAWRANGVKEDAGIISGEVRTRARAASIVRSRRTMKRSGSNSSAGGTIARRSAIRMASTDDASAPVRAGTSGTSTGTFQAAVGNAGAVPDPAEPGTVLATEQLMASLNGEAIAPLPAERGMVGPDPEGDGEAVSEQDVFDEYVYDKGEAGGDEDAEDAMAAIGSAFADLSTDVELDAGR